MNKLLLLLLLSGCANFGKITEKLPLDKIERKDNHFNVRWSKNLDPDYNTGNLPIGTSSPFIYEDILYQGNLKGQMIAYDLDKGTIIWKENEGQPINSKASIFKENVLYGTMNGRVYSRHYLTGKLNFGIDLGEPIESEIVVSQGRMFAHLRNHKIVAMDASTGKVFWSYRRSVPFTTTLQRVSKVLPYKDKLIVGFADGHIVSLSRDEGVVNWEQKITDGLKFVDVDTDPIYFNGYIVAGSAVGKMRFLNPDTGLILRTVDLTAAHAPLKVSDELVVGTVFGELARVDKSGQVIIKRKVSNAGISSVAPWKGGYAVGTMSGKVMMVDAKDLSPIETFELGSDQSAVFGFLQQSNDYLAIYSSRNRLYVFKNI
jgi:outer membrane protein assembly factor BamB